jgi:hypothetical protein
VRRYFEQPGQHSTAAASLRAAAAACHSRLLCRALEQHSEWCTDPIAALRAVVSGNADLHLRPSILSHPQLVEALHALASEDRDLQSWDNATAPPGPAANRAENGARGREALNNVALPCLLQLCPNWRGQVDLCTDSLGFLRVPSSAWCIWLRRPVAGGLEPMANTVVRLAMDGHLVQWALASACDAPFLIMSRRDCWKLVIDGDAALSIDRSACPSAEIRPRLIHSPLLEMSGLRYEPAGFDDTQFARHAGLTGALVEALLRSIRDTVPPVHKEVTLHIAAIRGHELPTSNGQTLESFSTPNQPGILNFNVPYSPADEPLLSPFCFTWLGHELGHTKHYLIDDAAYNEGWTFVRNPGDRTGCIPRYGRALGVRTVFQIPYVHLYELALQTTFLETEFAGLPWDVVEDPVAFGDDIADEIRESFELVERYADLTPLGRETVGHLHTMYDDAATRWNAARRA